MFQKLNLSIDTEPLRNALATTNLWDKYPFRRLGDSPHREMVDIWVRFNDIQKYLRVGSFKGLIDEHESVWYESDIAELVKPIANQLMQYVDGKKLGGILITKLPPNKKIYPHIDTGWHAEYYDKYYVCIKDSGSRFIFEDNEFQPKENEIWKFENNVTHSIINADGERIAMIICIKGKM